MHSNAASLHKGWTSLFQQWVFIFSSLAPHCVTLCSSLGPQLFTPHLLLYTPFLLPFFSQSFYIFFFVFCPLLPTLPFVLIYYVIIVPQLLVYIQHCWLFSLLTPTNLPRTVSAQWYVVTLLSEACVFVWLQPLAPNFQLHFPPNEDSEAAPGKRGSWVIEQAGRGWNENEGWKDASGCREKKVEGNPEEGGGEEGKKGCLEG